MSETATRLLFDSSAWIAYFFTGNKELVGHLEQEKTMIFSSVISLFEVRKKLKAEKYSEKETEKAVEFMKNNSIFLDVTENISEKAFGSFLENKLHLADAIIYATALEYNAMLIVT